MKYTVSIKSNPRLFILFVIVGLVAATAVAVFLVFGIMPGVIAVVVAVYFDYQLIKFLRLQLASYVEISEEGAQCLTSGGEHLYLPWDSVTHAGLCTAKSGRRTIFLYNETDDKLVTIPENFSGLDKLSTEISSHVEIAHYVLAANETARDRLRSLLSADETEED